MNSFVEKIFRSFNLCVRNFPETFSMAVESLGAVNFINVLRFVFTFSCSVLLSGCYNYISGYRIEGAQKEMESIQPGRSTGGEIMRKLGTPTLRATLLNPSREVLAYASETYSSFLFVRRNVRRRNIVVYYIDDDGVLEKVSHVEHFGNDLHVMGVVDIKFDKPNKSWTLPLYLIT